MKITWFGHSAFRVETGGAVIMIDPFISTNPTFEGNAKEAAAGATHVVLTHGHDDHVGDTVQICKDNGSVLVTNFELCMYLAGKGVENVSPANHGGRIAFDDFDVAFVPAWHSSSTIIDGQPVYLGNPAGIVVHPKAEPDNVLYHMGDTDIFSDMGLIAEIHKPAIGIVPVGDRFTMGAELAALACKKYFDFRTVIPCHFGTFPIIAPDAQAFVDKMQDQDVKVLTRGEPLEV